MQLEQAMATRLNNIIKERRIMRYQLVSKCGIRLSSLYKIIKADTEKLKNISFYKIIWLILRTGTSLKEFFDDPVFDEITD